MENNPGVWTYADSALVLIDYQDAMLEAIRSEPSAEVAVLNTRLIARAAKEFDVPIVLSTVGVKVGINGPTHDSILSELPGLEPLDRVSMNAFEDHAFNQAVKATGRKRLIFGGLHTEICLTFAVVEALKAGYEAMFVADAVGGRTQIAHQTAIDRMADAGAVPSSALAVVCELFRDWTTPQAQKARDIFDWYFAENQKLNTGLGLSDAEKRQVTQALENA
jgi:nicotinamidase-related amidase